MKRRTITKAALIFSCIIFVVWWSLGTSATLAWFQDTSPEAVNSFYFGELKVQVSFRGENMTDYIPMDASTEVFNRYALYEPGYTQAVYLKIENIGDLDFDYKLSVTVDKNRQHTRTAMGVLGNEIYLPNYLKYGVVFADSEPELNRLAAQGIADSYMLDTWSKPAPTSLSAGADPVYAALIVYMPEDVDNHANYRDDAPPTVGLGITVLAQQVGTMQT